LSNKIRHKIKEQTKSFPLSEAEFVFITSLDNVGKSVSYYMNELKTAYLKTLLPRMGYSPDDDLELAIDLNSPEHTLIVKKLPIEKKL